MNKILYPSSPSNVDPRILSPSTAFKKQVGTVVTSIALFFIVYFLLVIVAIALAAGCFYLGLWLMIQMPRFFTIMIGLGLMALGISVVVFLVKFIFSVSKHDNSSKIQVKEKDQPELFSFIRRLTKETATPFPKKIFLSADVNASVFYNSSFWSMFLPVRKNLEIGLGLVNSINISEFKAVIAHEFGHFSQRSMKLGSFTYNVNRVIYNMLYENTGYNKFLNSWANMSGYFQFFAGITVRIAQAIQWVLKQMYGVINKSYLGLSREMEFHADAVAASVSGGNNLVSALNRIELADSCYNTALHNADYWLKQNKASKNIFKNQLTIFRSMAKEHRLPLKDGLPEISYQFIQAFSQSRINYKNQWASHPTLQERKDRLERLQTDVAPDESRALLLFADADQLQETITANMYKTASVKENVEQFDEQYFEDWYMKEREASKLPAAYKGFYDGRFIETKDWDIDALAATATSKSFDELFNEETGQLQSAITNNENDIAIVRAIKDKHIDVKNFDFDGVKYETDSCDDVISKLQEDVTSLSSRLASLDKEAFAFFCQRSQQDKNRLIDSYKNYQVINNQYLDYADVANKVLETINPFYRGGTSIDDITDAVSSLKILHEKKLKEFFARLVAADVITPATKDDLHKRILSFNEADYAYFSDRFRNSELSELSDLAVKAAEVLNERRFECYKKILEEQLELGK